LVSNSTDEVFQLGHEWDLVPKHHQVSTETMPFVTSHFPHSIFHSPFPLLQIMHSHPFQEEEFRIHYHQIHYVLSYSHYFLQVLVFPTKPFDSPIHPLLFTSLLKNTEKNTKSRK